MTKPKQHAETTDRGGTSSTAEDQSLHPAPATPRGTARPRMDADSASFRRSITLQLGEDRSPNWETVTEKNRGIWREILSHPETVKALGLAPAAAPGPPSPGLPAGAVGALYDALARIEALACSAIFKVKFAEAVPLLAFTENEKEQLVPPTQELADKWVPVLMEKYGREFALSFLLFSITVPKIEAARMLPRKLEDVSTKLDAERGPEGKEAVQ